MDFRVQRFRLLYIFGMVDVVNNVNTIPYTMDKAAELLPK